MDKFLTLKHSFDDENFIRMQKQDDVLLQTTLNDDSTRLDSTQFDLNWQFSWLKRGMNIGTNCWKTKQTTHSPNKTKLKYDWMKNDDTFESSLWICVCLCVLQLTFFGVWLFDCCFNRQFIFFIFFFFLKRFFFSIWFLWKCHWVSTRIYRFCSPTPPFHIIGGHAPYLSAQNFTIFENAKFSS